MSKAHGMQKGKGAEGAFHPSLGIMMEQEADTCGFVLQV